jgi:two-component system KDP operon response regulator KdpE
VNPSIVIIEDERQIRRFLHSALEAEGFRVFEADTAKQGLIEAATRKPDLVVLDLGLPDRDGVEVIRDLRGWSQVPILVLSARTDEPDKVLALDAGADDYLIKPFGTAELLARVRVALRHRPTTQDGEPQFRLGDIRVDFTHRQVWRGDEEAHLTPLEYRLLTALIRNVGKVLTHRQLLLDVWGPAYVEHNHYLRIYMAQLRQKLEADPARPCYFLTETGVGYRLAMPA